MGLWPTHGRAMAELGALIGGVLTKKKRKQEGSYSQSIEWRVTAHQPFLLKLVHGDGTTWRREMQQVSNEQLRALTNVIHSLYDGAVPLPTQVKLEKHTREIRCLSRLKTSLYEQRALHWPWPCLLHYLRIGLKVLGVE